MAPVLFGVLVHEAQARTACAEGVVRAASCRHHPAAALQRDVRRRSAARCGLQDRIPARAARDPGAGRLDRRNAADRRARRSPARDAGHRHQVHPSRGPHRLQGRRARRGPEGRARQFRGDLRRRLHSEAGFPDAHHSLLHRRQGRAGAGALGPRQRRLFAADEDPGGAARRALRPRARQPQSRRLLLQLQRHRRHLAQGRDRRRRRLAARHADRRSRPQLPHAAQGLAVRVRAGSRRRPRSCRSR